MKEVTTKVLGNEPDLLVSTGCRSKLNAGTDDEMTITGYRLVRYDDELSYYLVWFGHSNDQHLLKYGKSGTG
jgi:hypothetical protein